MIYAGIDVEAGVDYNRNAWHIPGGGAGLRRGSDGSLRSVQLRNGTVSGIQNPMSYHRPVTRDTFTVPFEVSGEILLHSRAVDPWIYGENRAPTWNWVPTFSPVWVDEDNLIYTGCNPGVGWSASGQIDGKYGIPRASLYVRRPDTLELGRWYRWRMSVPAVGTHEVFIDDELVYRVVEKNPPAAWWNRPLRAALRLDFYDYSLRNLTGDDVPRYLTDIADVLRAAGLTVIEVPGWKTRARSSGGYAAGRPTHLMIHHTASPKRTDGQRDVDYIVSGSPVAPVANIYTDRQGVVWVCAAGATNTNGKGGPLDGVPADSMNVYAISNEIANDGIGEPYPAAQQQSVLTSSAALCRAYSIDVDHVRGHFEWTSRKIDPSGPSMWAASGKWNMDEFRDDVAATINPPAPPPPPTTEDTDMLLIVVHNNVEPKETWLTWTGAHLAHVVGHAAFVHVEAKTKRIDITDSQQADSLIRSSATTTPCPPEWVNTPRGAAWTSARA